MATNKMLTEQELTDLKEAFAVFDKDGDGRITKTEIRLVMESLGKTPSDQDVEDMMNEADMDGNGSIDLHEFVSMMKKKKTKKEEEREIIEAFRVFDVDGDGYVTAVELRKVMAKLGEHLTDDDVDSMIIAADADGDGRVDFKEFAKMMNPLQ